jgi:phage terminase large subunit
MKIDLQINRIYKPAINSQSRYLLVYGGAGSGKSHLAAQKNILRFINEPGHNIPIFRKVKETLQISVYENLQRMITQANLGGFFKFQKSAPKSIVCKNGSRAIFLGIDDPEKLKSLNKPTSMWLEEATEFTRDDFMQLDLRLRDITTYYQQLLLSFNPINQSHWLFDLFFSGKYPQYHENATIIQSTYKDNPFIDSKYKETLEALRLSNPEYYRVYCLGEWGKLEHQIYPAFKVINDFPETFDEVYYGLDFGFNNPTALIKVGVKDATFYLRELIYQSYLTTDRLIRQIQNNEVAKGDVIYCDSAEPQSIQELCNAGYNAKPSDKSVKDGINTVRELHPRIFSHPKNKNLNHEIMGYQYKRTKDNNVLEEPVKYEDHALDALRYALHTHNKHRKPEQRITVW